MLLAAFGPFFRPTAGVDVILASEDGSYLLVAQGGGSEYTHFALAMRVNDVGIVGVAEARPRYAILPSLSVAEAQLLVALIAAYGAR